MSERRRYDSEKHMMLGLLSYCGFCNRLYDAYTVVIYVGKRGHLCSRCWDDPKKDTDGWMEAVNR